MNGDYEVLKITTTGLDDNYKGGANLLLTTEVQKHRTTQVSKIAQERMNLL